MTSRGNNSALLFGQMPLADFLRDYWQQKPCLFRQAMPGFQSPLAADEVAGLALEDEIESRLIIEQPSPTGEPSQWTVQNGPFTEATLTALPETHWSLLVQAVDQWVPDVHALLAHFNFLPDWRLDDIMISVAPPGGSVGPHFDQYDVFLLQAEGKRHWQVGNRCGPNTALLDDAALKILANMELDPTQDWVLEPGDILYIPPVLAHHGVAETLSLTWSIGFRAPDAIEALHGLAMRGDLEPDAEFLRYTDGDLTVHESTETGISPAALNRVRTLMQTLLSRDEVVADWLGAFMTQNKYDLFDWAEIDTHAGTDTLVAGTLLAKALPTRITAYEQRLYVNGRAFPLTIEDQPLIDTLMTDDRWTWGTLINLAHSPQAIETLQTLVLSDSLSIEDD
ncbi:MAG: cupin domain-containing protein [Natronospirillum sp.]